ncbi:3-hydroxyacyl-CoA dehydrogenase family protein [Janibacter sp. DB-40]|uniref:3-hydroxyacyl-CoA dehydrogenase family protein n=1 Tax=Janibacter sp. DB-40 TaxID=3028808 RepID=UPI002404E8D7|nr:3-hydroxyacyl-CoA dehydrogenase family protein [Janibacter sp. DB-40]
MADITKVLVVGSGAMGAQIAMVCSLAGLEVAVQDVAEASLERAREELTQRMQRSVDKGRITAEERDASFTRMRFGTDLAEAAKGVDIAIEAAVEKIDVKRSLFADLDRLTPEHAILATNSSSFVPSKIADATTRPDRVVGMHFFNPALVMKCVEVVRGPQTSDETAAMTVALVERLGKTAVVVDKEIPGFIANRLLNAVRDEAIRLLEGGYASVESIDTAARTALGYPMGPFELMDLTGIDIGYHTKQARFEETGHPADAPSRSVVDKVERGELGRKTGKGWYDYTNEGNH